MGAAKSSLPDGYKYWAFISYSHRDAKWANWLHKNLETAIIPKNLVGTTKQYGKIPLRVFPIFLDREELASSSNLPERIRDALKHSHYLIVVCSPAAARSYYVNLEIAEFKALGREDRVLSLIVAGEPNKSEQVRLGADDCFPNALRYGLNAQGNLIEGESEPLAADVRPGKDGKRNAILKLMSGVLEVDFSDFKQRDRQRRLQRLRQYAWGVALVLLLTVPGLCWWNSPWGQMWQAQRDMLASSRNIQLQLAQQMVAAALVGLGDSEGAQQIFAAIDDPGQRVGALLVTAKECAQIGKTVDATMLMTSAFRVAETIRDSVNRAQLMLYIAEVSLEIGDKAETTRILERALQAASEISEPSIRAAALLGTANGNAMIGKVPQALELVDEAHRLLPTIKDPRERGQLLFNTVQTAAKFGDATRASLMLEEARKVAMTAPPRDRLGTLLDAAKAAAKIGNAPLTSDLLQESLRVFNTSPDPTERALSLLEVAKAAGQSGNVPQALELVEEARRIAKIVRPEGMFMVLNGISSTVFQIVAEISDKAQALALLEQVRQIALEFPMSTDLKYMFLAQRAETIAKMASRIKDVALLESAYRAVDEIDDAHMRSGAWEWIVSGTAQFVRETKDTTFIEKAKNAVKEIQQPVQRAFAVFELAEAMKGIGDVQRAVDFANQAHQILERAAEQDLKPDEVKEKFLLMPKIINLIAEVGVQNNDETLFDTAIKGSSLSNGPALRTIVRYYAEHGEWRKARNIAMLNGTDEYKAMGLANILDVWATQRNPSLGAERANRLVGVEGELLTQRGQYQEAMALYNRALSEKYDTDLVYARAMLADKMGRLDILERDLRQILEKDPNNVQALNALGYTLADQTQRKEEAYQLIKKALELRPNDSNILDSMGWVLFRLGRLQEAAAHLRRAKVLSNGSDVAAHLGEVLWVMGDQESARMVWQSGLATAPGDRKLLDVMKRLAK